MTPYSHDIRCTRCKTQLTISAVRDQEPGSKTAFAVSCPACQNDVQVEVPVSVLLASVQVVGFERPTKN